MGTRNKLDPLSHLIDQYNYHTWSNKRLFDHLRSLPEEVIHREVESVFPTLATVLVHVYFTETIWLKVMQGKAFDTIEEYVDRQLLTSSYAEKSLEDIESDYQRLEADFRSFLKATSDPMLELSIQHPTFGEMEISIFHLVGHLINHATYHRGNITAMLRQSGYKGISTDYVVYHMNMNHQQNT
ncbi:DinB family protein [Sediminibacillus sp. JSM 1682029]|uniref:DinB family protein n=1 Tax=Sediminibacillus sp. JSM 1682029 TaxID=3229857 RepID=UPI003524B6AC